MDDELPGQLPLFERGDAVIVRMVAEGEPVQEYTIQHYIPWNETDEREPEV
jgi:hypothetical protein